MYRRYIIGLLSCLCLLAAAGMFATSGYTDSNAFWLGLMVRLGIVLLTIYLAWPSLAKLSGRVPHIVMGTLLAGLAFFVIRPKLLPLIAAAVVLTLGIHFGLRILSRGVGRG